MDVGSGGMGAAGMGAGGAGGMGAGGMGAAAGSGGRFVPPMQPAQAGTSAPPPVTMPAMNAPMMTPPVTTPAMTTPASTPAAGTGGVSAGSGGAGAMPYTFSAPRRQAQEPGCSVALAGSGTHDNAQLGFVLLGLSLIARRLARARSIAK
jgi:hypothetical protein